MPIARSLFASVLLALSLNSHAVDACGGQSSTGNPNSCCTNGGSAEWWGWKKADDAGWASIPTGPANTWDDQAQAQPEIFEVKTAPEIGSLAIKETRPYCLERDATGNCTKVNTSGHLAYVTGFIYNSNNHLTGVTTTEMSCAGPGGTTSVDRPLSFFDKYIRAMVRKDLTGKNLEDTDCRHTGYIASSYYSWYHNLTQVGVFRSELCNAYWTRLFKPNDNDKAVVAIGRSSDALELTQKYTVTPSNGAALFSPLVTASASRKEAVCGSAKVNGAPPPGYATQCDEPNLVLKGREGGQLPTDACRLDAVTIKPLFYDFDPSHVDPIFLRYSPSCNTYWADKPSFGYSKSVQMSISRADGLSLLRTYHDVNTTGRSTLPVAPLSTSMIQPADGSDTICISALLDHQEPIRTVCNR